MENRPLTIEGTREDGTALSTARWKGKVILVDFWATWCRPCRDALPQVKQAYADFHGKGLEVLGVSAAHSAQDCQSFLDRNNDMAWPQLFDAASPGVPRLAKAYGVAVMPTRFLIDRKGVLRSITTGESFEALIPKLLAERG
jgi:thiol-disulfide isomerase/thioredoxin